MDPSTQSAPTPNITSTATSVVIPLDRSGNRRAASTLPIMAVAVTERNPATIGHGPRCTVSKAQMAPHMLMSANVRKPAISDLERSRWSPTSKPSPKAAASDWNVSIRSTPRR